jgi:hypothetical protein
MVTVGLGAVQSCTGDRDRVVRLISIAGMSTY